MIRQNLKYKILAVAAALTLYMMNARTDVKPLTFVSVHTELQVVHLDPSLKVVSSPTVSVPLQGPKDAVDDLRSRPDHGAADVNAVVDLAGKTAGTYSVEVQVSAKKPLRPVPGDPLMATIRLERIVSKPLSVEVVPDGPASADYRWESTRVTPNVASVRGPSSLLDDVARLEVGMPAGDTAGDIERMVEIRAVDNRDQEVKGVEVFPEKARVSVRVARFLRYRVVPIRLETTGTPAPGFRVATIQVSPLTVTIAGSGRALDAVTAVPTEPVDVTGASATIVRDVRLLPPRGVQTVPDAPAKAKIYFTEEPIPAP